MGLRLPTLLVLGVQAACVDYGVTPPPPERDPRLTVTQRPLEEGACPDTPVEVDLQSVGDAALTVRQVAVTGADWTLEEPDLPLRLDPGSSYVLTLFGSGDADLTVVSDDASTPILTAAVHTVPNAPPDAVFVAPTEEQTVPVASDLTLLAFVADDDDALDGLTVTLASNLTGEIAVVSPDVDGRVEYLWAGDDRAAGPQTVTLDVQDACAVAGHAFAWFCQDGPYVVHPIVEEAWHFEGAADIDGEILTLTEAAPDLVATAFDLATDYDGDDVEIVFDVQIGEGTGGEGVALVLLDAYEREGYLGGNGCGFGFGGGAGCTDGPALPGWALAIDTHADDGDCLSEPHLAFYVDGDMTAPGPCAPAPGVSDGAWHTVHVRIVDATLTVVLDGIEVMNEAIDADYFQGHLGFGATTGSATNAHRIRAVEATDYSCGMEPA